MPLASGAPSAAVDTPPPVSAKAFCERVVALGEKHYAGAPVSDQENIPCGHHVRPLRKVASECALRVESPSVEFHGDVAARCLEAAERCRFVSFYAFDQVPACRGVVTGKVGEGQPAMFDEACAPGLSLVHGRCVKPVPKNADCAEFPGGYLGDPAAQPRCEPGAECIQTGFGADGTPLVFTCFATQATGQPCKLDLDVCASGLSCYQGKCRARSPVGGDCMKDRDCEDLLGCEISGGVFGHCVPRPTTGYSCDPPKP